MSARLLVFNHFHTSLSKPLPRERDHADTCALPRILMKHTGCWVVLFGAVAILLTSELDHCSNVLICFPGPPRNKRRAVLCVSLTYGPCSKIPCLPTGRRIRKIWCRGESAHRGQGLPTHRTEGFRPCAAGFRIQYTYVTVRSTRRQLRITPGPKAAWIANG